MSAKFVRFRDPNIKLCLLLILLINAMKFVIIGASKKIFIGTYKRCLSNGYIFFLLFFEEKNNRQRIAIGIYHLVFNIHSYEE